MTGRSEQDGKPQLPHSLSGPSLSCVSGNGGGLWGRMRADHGYVPALESWREPACRASRVWWGSGGWIHSPGGGRVAERRGGEWVTAPRFQESLHKFPDTNSGDFISWTPEEDSSPASGDCRAWPGPQPSTPRLRGRLIFPSRLAPTGGEPN